MSATINALAAFIEDQPPSVMEYPQELAYAILDHLGIAYTTEDSSTLIETVNGTYGLAYEPSSLSYNAGPRVLFRTSPDDHEIIKAHLLMDGKVEVRTEGMGYRMVVRPQSTNVATIAVEGGR